MTYRELFEQVKDKLDDKILIHGRDFGVCEAILRFTEEDSRESADVSYEVMQNDNDVVVVGLPFLTL